MRYLGLLKTILIVATLAILITFMFIMFSIHILWEKCHDG